MSCDEVIKKRPFEPCAVSAVNPIAVTRKLNPSFVIDDAEVGAEIDVILGLKIEFGFFAENFDYFIVFLFAGKKVVVGHVGKFCDEIGDFLLICVDFRVAFGNFVAYGSHARENFFNGLAFLFILRDFRRNFVSFGFQSLDFAHEFLSCGVEL